ncbi:acid phosphatase/Vanadium-dependent haloperoxidase [Macroventuria anomochaeta]|uniref:Acid phosphatase/Vanadium-dependent haloperoxidase n=1 Tax=Macroventuria anomochaeta TaxID=301207 RepID=A0ACB6RM50_9PLEO|nr:acid phosphatase/Vanadium-dependent haloperoxidase [Macroventuria anomochaeta]KAF2622178.1 acid phosphatase/Vanadium-dependent haloperoxidase [Macroventuria anomochaeta]
MPTFTGLSVPSLRLVLSYIFDWICIIAIAAVGAGWEYLTPYKRPFSPVNLDISYPFEEHETIPTWLMAVIGLVIPAAIIFLVCIIFVPGPTASRGTPKLLIWRRKLWEWNTGWMGLALSLATAFMVTQGMKLLFGKPRPDLLSRCRPDLGRLAQAAVGNYVGGGAGDNELNPAWVMVTDAICQNTNEDIMKDGFKSFPSGHASFSWAGLLYLTLFLASKFSVAIPFLAPRPFSTNPAYTSAITPSNLKSRASTDRSILPVHKQESSLTAPGYSENDAVVPIRYQSAAPPVYTLVLILTPVGTAIYVASTRFTDFRHFGFDLLFGSLIGITTAWFSFRWYHLPITRGAGWAWGPRSYQRAWGIGVGVGSYVGTEGWSRQGKSETQRNGPNTNGVHHQGYAAEATSQDGIIEMERRDGLRGRNDGTAAGQPIYVSHAQGAHVV